MNRRITSSIMLLFAFSFFVIPAYAKPEVSGQSFFMVLPNRHYGIAVNVVLSGKYDPSLVKVVVEEVQPRYIPELEVGISERGGMIFTEPTTPSHEAEPNTICAVRVNVFLNNVRHYGFALIEINDYATVSSPVRADLVPYPN